MGLELRISSPQQPDQFISVEQSRVVCGTLPSNAVVLQGPSIDPIHAMLEEDPPGTWRVTDLGSTTGVFVNGVQFQVEAVVRIGDSVKIGSVQLTLADQRLVKETQKIPMPVVNFTEDVIPTPPHIFTAPPRPTAPMLSEETSVSIPVAQPKPSQTVASSEFAKSSSTSSNEVDRRQEKRDILFNPRKAKPSGDVLEFVSYWNEMVLDVDLFHPKIPHYNKVLIGSAKGTHFIAGGEQEVKSHALVDVREDGYKLTLLPGMEARIRKNGSVETVTSGTVSLGRRDLAHIKYGALRYFMLFINPPTIDLPKSGPRDPFFVMMMSVASILYLAFAAIILVTAPKLEEKEKPDDPWSLVSIPELEKPPVPEVKPKVEKIEIAEVKTPPPAPVTPPKPAPKPVQPAKPIEAEKPKQEKPVEKPVVQNEKKPTEALTPPKPQVKPDTASAKANDLAKLSKGTAGMASTGAKQPDFKLAGAKTDKPLGPAGGKDGSGMNQQGGERKGNQKSSVRGVEGPNNNKASGINLDKLGIGVGNILDKTGPSAVATNFKSSAGGAGGGSGSGSRTLGLGGVGNGRSLGIAGSEGAANNFGGGGTGGYLSGEGGNGGRGGAGIGKDFGDGGRSRAAISVPSEDIVASSGLTPQEVLAVIKANLNQIRHCYEQLLQRSPNAAGKLSVKFIVGVSGRVDSASFDGGDLNDANMQGCVVGKIRRWKFPEPRGGQPVTVSYPFVFNPL